MGNIRQSTKPGQAILIEKMRVENQRQLQESLAREEKLIAKVKGLKKEVKRLKKLSMRCNIMKEM